PPDRHSPRSFPRRWEGVWRPALAGGSRSSQFDFVIVAAERAFEFAFGATASIGAEEFLRPYERPRPLYDLGHAAEKPLHGDRFGDDLGHARIARRLDAMAFGVSGHHDDRNVGVGHVFRTAHE